MLRMRLRDRAPSSRPCRSRSRARPARARPNDAREVERRRRERRCRSAAAASSQRALLRRRHAALAQHEAADRPQRARRGASASGSSRHRRESRRGRRPACASASLRSSVRGVVSRRRRVFDAQRLRVLPRAVASDHARRGFHASSLRTPSRVDAPHGELVRRSRSRRSRPSTRRCRSGDSTARPAAGTARPFARCSSTKLAVVAVGREQHDRVDRDRGSPTARTIVAPLIAIASRNVAMPEGNSVTRSVVAVAPARSGRRFSCPASTSRPQCAWSSASLHSSAPAPA